MLLARVQLRQRPCLTLTVVNQLSVINDTINKIIEINAQMNAFI
jgi:hypothetical protein